jgi:hypothetical protein
MLLNAGIVSWLAGLAGWAAIVTLTLAVLTMAKRADERLERDVLARDDTFGQIDLAALAACLGRPATGLVVALREPRVAGQVIAVRAEGDAAQLAGQVLPPDDFLAARAVLTGRCESRPHAAAVPLRRGGHTIGAIGVSIPNDRVPLRRGEMDALARAVAALDTAA